MLSVSIRVLLNGTRVSTDDTDFHGFYLCPSVPSVSIRVLLNGTRVSTDDTDFRGCYLCPSVSSVFIRVLLKGLRMFYSYGSVAPVFIHAPFCAVFGVGAESGKGSNPGTPDRGPGSAGKFPPGLRRW